MNIDMIGPALVLGLGCIGSAIGCAIGGMASHGVMSRVEENHGKFIGMSAIPSTQAIYAILLMLIMKGAIVAKTLSAASGIGIGAAVGMTILVSSIYQGMCAATAIQAVAKQPAVFGKCAAMIGIVESFSLFAFVFALLLMNA
jgi:V/A-type H+-transporting ATPase subunit K